MFLGESEILKTIYSIATLKAILKIDLEISEQKRKKDLPNIVHPKQIEIRRENELKGYFFAHSHFKNLSVSSL